MPKMRKISSGGRERCREYREFRLKRLKSLDLRAVFAGKTAKRSGKKQGMPGLTVPLNPNEAGIDLINFPQNFFRKVFNQRSCAVSVAF